ncbi:hypothetical protein THTE_0750 [Thermogutta terrifontis]|uniref:Uncharacterized protein n=1 Tax=Thermogutta terrifontis TaxID=1331910 RepID=A0A286RBL3_9BACT|nr:hypothetical protein THTE_0750 [Thermogutta terrifontis]
MINPDENAGQHKRGTINESISKGVFRKRYVYGRGIYVSKKMQGEGLPEDHP